MATWTVLMGCALARAPLHAAAVHGRRPVVAATPLVVRAAGGAARGALPGRIQWCGGVDISATPPPPVGRGRGQLSLRERVTACRRAAAAEEGRRGTTAAAARSGGGCALPSDRTRAPPALMTPTPPAPDCQPCRGGATVLRTVSRALCRSPPVAATATSRSLGGGPGDTAATTCVAVARRASVHSPRFSGRVPTRRRRPPDRWGRGTQGRGSRSTDGTPPPPSPTAYVRTGRRAATVLPPGSSQPLLPRDPHLPRVATAGTYQMQHAVPNITHSAHHTVARLTKLTVIRAYLNSLPPTIARLLADASDGV